jgi:hypothetical protein
MLTHFRPQKHPGASHFRVLLSTGRYDFKANMATHNCFQLLLPPAVKSIIVSESPIVVTDGGHKRDGKVDIAVRP